MEMTCVGWGFRVLEFHFFLLVFPAKCSSSFSERFLLYGAQVQLPLSSHHLGSAYILFYNLSETPHNWAVSGLLNILPSVGNVFDVPCLLGLTSLQFHKQKSYKNRSIW
jgi:hypothetical protein